MKKIFHIFPLAISLLAFSCNEPSPEVPVQKQKSIVIIYENDVHCALEGYPKFAAYRDAIRDADTSYVLTVSCGDFIQGGMAGVLSKGEYPIDMMNSVGYDAVTIGNHELDYRLPRMMELLAKLNAPVVNVNLSDADGKRLFQPYVIKQCGDRKVAFVGGLSPNTEYKEFYAFFDKDGNRLLSVNEDTLIADVQKAVDDARAQGADYVIFLSHVGDDEGNVNSIQIARSTTGIDVVLDAHTHYAYYQEYLFNKAGEKVYFSQAGTEFNYLGKLVITPDGKPYTRLVPLKSYLSSSAKVKATLDSVNVLIDRTASAVVGHCEKTLGITDNGGRRISRNHECPVGNLIADALRSVAGAQMGFVNGGGIRAEIKQGDVKFSDLVNACPFGNQVCLAKCKGSGIAAMLARCAVAYPNENGSFLQVSGVRFKIDAGHGNRIANLMVEGADGQFRAIDPDAEYTVGTTDYVLEDNKDVLGSVDILEGNLMLDYEALIKYVSDTLGGVISSDYAELKGRIN